MICSSIISSKKIKMCINIVDDNDGDNNWLDRIFVSVNCKIALKYDRHIGSSGADVPVKILSDVIF